MSPTRCYYCCSMLTSSSASGGQSKFQKTSEEDKLTLRRRSTLSASCCLSHLSDLSDDRLIWIKKIVIFIIFDSYATFATLRGRGIPRWRRGPAQLYSCSFTRIQSRLGFVLTLSLLLQFMPGVRLKKCIFRHGVSIGKSNTGWSSFRGLYQGSLLSVLLLTWGGRSIRARKFQ